MLSVFVSSLIYIEKPLSEKSTTDITHLDIHMLSIIEILQREVSLPPKEGPDLHVTTCYTSNMAVICQPTYGIPTKIKPMFIAESLIEVN